MIPKNPTVTGLIANNVGGRRVARRGGGGKAEEESLERKHLWQLCMPGLLAAATFGRASI
jgi:hypothetical protein